MAGTRRVGDVKERAGGEVGAADPDCGPAVRADR